MDILSMLHRQIFLINIIKRLLSWKTNAFGYILQYELGEGVELFYMLGGGGGEFFCELRGCNICSGHWPNFPTPGIKWPLPNSETNWWKLIYLHVTHLSNISFLPLFATKNPVFSFPQIRMGHCLDRIQCWLVCDVLFVRGRGVLPSAGVRQTLCNKW